MVIRRVKDKWHNSTPEDPARDVLTEKTVQDQASALAYIIWGKALNGAINLHAEDFRYDDDQQRIGVLSELLAFQVQLVDRRASEFLQASNRSELLQALCTKLADQVQDNLSDIAGPGNYRPPFIKLLNNRFADYSNFAFAAQQPGYQCYRYLGSRVLEHMGDDQTNRWVIDQIMEIDAPDLTEQLNKSINRLFGL